MHREHSKGRSGGIVTSVICGPVLLFATLVPTFVHAQQSQLGWSITAQNRFPTEQIHLNQTYRTLGDWRGQPDLYLPESVQRTPVVLFFHGGGWLGPRPKEGRVLYLLPWLEMGYAVVNVDYRDDVMAKAPAMVEDARCALRWVVDRTVGSWTVSSTGLGQQSRVS